MQLACLTTVTARDWGACLHAQQGCNVMITARPDKLQKCYDCGNNKIARNNCKVAV